MFCCKIKTYIVRYMCWCIEKKSIDIDKSICLDYYSATLQWCTHHHHHHHHRYHFKMRPTHISFLWRWAIDLAKSATSVKIVLLLMIYVCRTIHLRTHTHTHCFPCFFYCLPLKSFSLLLNGWEIKCDNVQKINNWIAQLNQIARRYGMEMRLNKTE